MSLPVKFNNVFNEVTSKYHRGREDRLKLFELTDYRVTENSISR